MTEKEPLLTNGRNSTGSFVGGINTVSSSNSGRQTASSFNSGRQTANSFNSGRDTANSLKGIGRDGVEDSLTGSRTGSAIDGTVNVSFDDDSDYHDYDSRNDHARGIGNITGTVLYKRRWYILFILSMCVMLQNAVWGTWGPIAESAKFVYGWDTTMLFIIINCGNLGVLLPLLFTGPMVSSKGLRFSMILCTFLMTVGSGLRVISQHGTVATVLIGAGQFCNGLSVSITQVIPAALSETWFPLNERATATAIGVLSSSLGSLAAFLIGPNIVDEPIKNQTPPIESQNFQQKEEDRISHQIWILTLTEFGIGAVLLISTVLYYPAEPPTPPSKSAKEERETLLQGLKSVFRRPMVLLAAVSCAVPWAISVNWMGLLDVNLHDIGISQKQAGLFGVYASAASLVVGIAIGRIADRFQRRLKLFVLIMFIVALALIIYITCMRNGYLNRSKALFAVSIAALGVMMNAALPLCYEMTCECGYPIHEGIIGTVVSLSINAAAVIFLLIKLIPSIGINWINWTFVGVQATGIFCLALFKEQYNRANVDVNPTASIENNRS